MYIVGLTTHHQARRHGHERPYLARMKVGVYGEVDREFFPVKKVGENRRSMAARALPGDVFEARRWLWDSDRGQYGGGTVWFAVDLSGRICMLTRDEAFQAILAVKLFDASPENFFPAIVYPHRIVPPDISIRLANDPIVCPQQMLTVGNADET